MKNSVRISGLVGEYKFDTFTQAIIRLAKWIEDGLISEDEVMKAIYELFHEIPEEKYNSIIEKL